MRQLLTVPAPLRSQASSPPAQARRMHSRESSPVALASQELTKKLTIAPSSTEAANPRINVGMQVQTKTFVLKPDHAESHRIH